MSELEDEAAFKELPYYKSIVKSLLRKQIAALLEEMALETGEESVIVIANSSTGTTSCLSSSNAKCFIEEHADIQNQFLSFCLSGYKSATGIEIRTPKSAKRKQNVTWKSAKTSKRAKFNDSSPISTKTTDTSLSESVLGSEKAASAMSVTSAMSVASAMSVTSAASVNTLSQSDVTQPPPLILGVYPENPEDESISNSDVTSGVNIEYNNSVLNIKVEPLSDTGIIENSTSSNIILESDSFSQRSQSQEDEQSDNSSMSQIHSFDGSMSQTSSFDSPANLTPTTQTLGPIRYVRKFPPKERTTLSLHEKIQIIQEFESGETVSQRKLAEKYSISKSSVAEMIKNRHLLKEHYEFNANTKRKRFNTNSKFAEVNEQVWQWFKTARENGVQMSGPMIQEKGLQIAQQLQAKDFKGSNGWLHSWRNRYNVTSYKDDSFGSPKLNYINDYSKVEGFNPTSENSEAANAIMNLCGLTNPGNINSAGEQMLPSSINSPESSESPQRGGVTTDKKSLEDKSNVSSEDKFESSVGEERDKDRIAADQQNIVGIKEQRKQESFLQTQAYEKIVDNAISEYDATS